MEPLHPLGDQRVRQRVLVVEVEVDARRAAPDRAGDLAHRQRVVAVGDEQVAGVVQDDAPEVGVGLGTAGGGGGGHEAGAEEGCRIEPGERRRGAGALPAELCGPPRRRHPAPGQSPWPAPATAPDSTGHRLQERTQRARRRNGARQRAWRAGSKAPAPLPALQTTRSAHAHLPPPLARDRAPARRRAVLPLRRGLDHVRPRLGHVPVDRPPARPGPRYWSTS